MTAIYIIYNADGTTVGKLKYAYTKLRSSASDSPCSACDLTHNGLNLTETAEWTATKSKIAAEVHQLHRDELSDELKHFIAEQNLKLPVVLGQKSKDAPLKLLLDRQELGVLSKDHGHFLEVLQRYSLEKGIKI
ncbi:hypothetical protein B0A49_12427 [Cryomyces minteri]|uniref:Uncharacterized protein n=1 Tax=Cryomyces minteri TaxID=331657 RepID=A0A4U0V4S7_9PEZI|nr:hypothetical protein B0A49_12954 [Cryomyces minteri]TKA42735.1 hypothetical protein B0A49_12531 [Cryomyces minteri]TKA62240.1 hypothetical protein B0A49_12427 [Cryomyces minteri]